MAQDEKIDDVSRFRQELLAPFQKLKVSDLDLSQKPIILSAKLTPRQALEELIKHHLRCAPVVDGDKFIGVFDLRDAIKFAMEVYRSKHLKEDDLVAMEYIAVSPHISTNTLAYLGIVYQTKILSIFWRYFVLFFFVTKGGEEVTRMRKFWAVKESDSVLSMLKIVAKGSHIVGVLSSDGKQLKSILSQGQVFQQISKLWTEFKEDVPVETLKKLGYVKSPVVSISSKTPAHEAFALMANHQLSGLAVVDEDGILFCFLFILSRIVAAFLQKKQYLEKRKIWKKQALQLDYLMEECV
ncbi:hypothetical protein RFI_17173 [Reticulomyxa filosa]|uniref:CBS domain-containing protein n=1 Tax=Reticulomyxa filosa TaxID=46433 RepID=X6N2A7_RETFI|nr:hypothetical protein RFI_17173 [Reticulomyxa filosa]|eukprot:ETO20048.1 hypothetical protein RFI_17173 [Reticulomyxa filosa]